MQAELSYYGKFRDLEYLDAIPWNHFAFFHSWLRKTKKEEKQAHEKAQREREQAMASMRSRRGSYSRGAPRAPVTSRSYR